MTKETIEKLHKLETLERTARNLLSNGTINETEIKYLFQFDDDFHKEIVEMRNRYLDKYTKGIEEL